MTYEDIDIDEDAVLKEVWNTDEIDAKTELTPLQIANINKLKTLATIFGSGLLKQHINDFMVLQKSKDRKSMGEFVEVVKAKKEDKLDFGKNSFMRGMMG